MEERRKAIQPSEVLRSIEDPVALVMYQGLLRVKSDLPLMAYFSSLGNRHGYTYDELVSALDYLVKTGLVQEVKLEAPVGIEKWILRPKV